MRALRPSAGLSALRRRTAGPPRPFPAAFPVVDGHVTAPRAAPLGGRWGGRGQPRSARGARRGAQAAARTGRRRLNVSVCCIVPDSSLGHGEGRKAGLRELLVSPPPRSPSSDCAQPRDRAAAGRSHCRSRRGERRALRALSGRRAVRLHPTGSCFLVPISFYPHPALRRSLTAGEQRGAACPALHPPPAAPWDGTGRRSACVSCPQPRDGPGRGARSRGERAGERSRGRAGPGLGRAGPEGTGR